MMTHNFTFGGSFAIVVGAKMSRLALPSQVLHIHCTAGI